MLAQCEMLTTNFRYLQIKSDAEAQDGSFYGTAGSGRILVQNVGCDGSEAALLNCSNDSSIPCSHDNEVAVFCQVNCEF